MADKLEDIIQLATLVNPTPTQLQSLRTKILEKGALNGAIIKPKKQFSVFLSEKKMNGKAEYIIWPNQTVQVLRPVPFKWTFRLQVEYMVDWEKKQWFIFPQFSDWLATFTVVEGKKKVLPFDWAVFRKYFPSLSDHPSKEEVKEAFDTLQRNVKNARSNLALLRQNNEQSSTTLATIRDSIAEKKKALLPLAPYANIEPKKAEKMEILELMDAVFPAITSLLEKAGNFWDEELVGSIRTLTWQVQNLEAQLEIEGKDFDSLITITALLWKSEDWESIKTKDEYKRLAGQNQKLIDGIITARRERQKQGLVVVPFWAWVKAVKRGGQFLSVLALKAGSQEYEILNLWDAVITGISHDSVSNKVKVITSKWAIFLDALTGQRVEEAKKVELEEEVIELDGLMIKVVRKKEWGTKIFKRNGINWTEIEGKALGNSGYTSVDLDLNGQGSFLLIDQQGKLVKVGDTYKFHNLTIEKIFIKLWQPYPALSYRIQLSDRKIFEEMGEHFGYTLLTEVWTSTQSIIDNKWDFVDTVKDGKRMGKVQELLKKLQLEPNRDVEYFVKNNLPFDTDLQTILLAIWTNALTIFVVTKTKENPQKDSTIERFEVFMISRFFRQIWESPFVIVSRPDESQTIMDSRTLQSVGWFTTPQTLNEINKGRGMLYIEAIDPQKRFYKIASTSHFGIFDTQNQTFIPLSWNALFSASRGLTEKDFVWEKGNIYLREWETIMWYTFFRAIQWKYPRNILAKKGDTFVPVVTIPNWNKFWIDYKVCINTTTLALFTGATGSAVFWEDLKSDKAKFVLTDDGTLQLIEKQWALNNATKWSDFFIYKKDGKSILIYQQKEFTIISDKYKPGWMQSISSEGNIIFKVTMNQPNWNPMRYFFVEDNHILPFNDDITEIILQQGDTYTVLIRGIHATIRKKNKMLILLSEVFLLWNKFGWLKFWYTNVDGDRKLTTRAWYPWQKQFVKKRAVIGDNTAYFTVQDPAKKDESYYIVKVSDLGNIDIYPKTGVYPAGANPKTELETLGITENTNFEDVK